MLRSMLTSLTRSNLFNASWAVILLGPAIALAQSDPILLYKSTHDLLPTDDYFWVAVYEDGDALVHYPVYMKKAGDYTVQLSAAEVQEIRLLLRHPLVQSFNPGQIKSQQQALDAQQTELFEISDNSYSHFSIGQRNSIQTIRWTNLPVDANRYPQIGVLRKLADIEASLLQLDQHSTAALVE